MLFKLVRQGEIRSVYVVVVVDHFCDYFRVSSFNEEIRVSEQLLIFSFNNVDSYEVLNYPIYSTRRFMCYG